MRYAIISDIHGNLHALQAVVEEIEKDCVEMFLCLGDIVGYGAYPNECVELVRNLCSLTVAGNHDYAVLERIGIENFNSLAKVSTHWTRDKLSEENRVYLEEIPLVHEYGSITIVHGSLFSPELFDYIQSPYEAALSLQKTTGKVCFIGHSHIPVAFIQNPSIRYTLEEEVRIPEKGKALINVGSVGQPRDSNPRASYAIYDDEADTAWIRRIPYDIEAAIEGIRSSGLPGPLGDRLRFGR